MFVLIPVSQERLGLSLRTFPVLPRPHEPGVSNVQFFGILHRVKQTPKQMFHLQRGPTSLRYSMLRFRSNNVHDDFLKLCVLLRPALHAWSEEPRSGKFHVTFPKRASLLFQVQNKGWCAHFYHFNRRQQVGHIVLPIFVLVNIRNSFYVLLDGSITEQSDEMVAPIIRGNDVIMMQGDLLVAPSLAFICFISHF